MNLNHLSTICFILSILQLLHCATWVDSTRPCQEITNLQGAESYELRPKDGYFTLVNHGSSSSSAEMRQRCGSNFVYPIGSENGKTILGSKDTTLQHLQWPETRGSEKQQEGGTSNFGASKDLVVTLEEKPMEQEKERMVVVDRINAEGEKKEPQDVPAYVIVRGPKMMERDSKNLQPQDQMVTISLDMLNGLIKGSLLPPSGPNMEHNWYVAGQTLPEQKAYKDYSAADQMLLVRVMPAGKDVVNVVDADGLPGFQEMPDGTYRIKD